MDVAYYAPFGNLKYVFVIINICSSFVNALTLSGERAVNVIRALTLTMVVMRAPWPLKPDNGPAYVSRQFNKFLGPRKISHTTGIP